MRWAVAAAAAVALAAPAAVAQAPVAFQVSPTSGEAIAVAPNSGPLYIRRSGVAGGPDDTVPVTVEGFTHHASAWQTIDLTAYGVPANALRVDLGVRAVITKGDVPYGTSVYLHARPYGSAECRGPDGYENYPLDGTYGGQPTQDCLIAQTVAVAPGDQRRDTSTWPVMVHDGKIQLSWGYRRAPGEFPVGDAVAIVVYLNAYSV